MLDRISVDELNSLASVRGDRRVSIFLPTVTAGPDTRQNPIRWKNLLREAEDELVKLDMRPEEARQMLAPGWDLESDNDFWQHQGEGLGAYFSSESLQVYRLPIAVEQTAVVSDEFHVKPLLPLFSENGPFYVLALSQNSVRLLSGHRFHLGEVRVPDLPKSMDAALWADKPDDQHQFHTVNTGTTGRGNAIFHGTGDDAQDRHKDDLKRYFDIVDRAVCSYLNGQHAPLVIASVDYLQPIYRDANGYANLLDEGVDGNPEQLGEAELGQAAWPIVEQYYKADAEKAAERFGNQIGTGLASGDVQQILKAAHEGRIDTLWLSSGDAIWGKVEEDGSVRGIHSEKQPGDKDLIDVAATRTLATGGRIYTVETEEIPGGTAMAAIMRY